MLTGAVSRMAGGYFFFAIGLALAMAASRSARETSPSAAFTPLMKKVGVPVTPDSAAEWLLPQLA